jgi:ubiquinone/menaquinone biosynthesis C-methylase UbiE
MVFGLLLSGIVATVGQSLLHDDLIIYGGKKVKSIVMEEQWIKKIKNLSSHEREQLYNKLFIYSFKIVKPITVRAHFLAEFARLVQNAKSDVDFVKQLTKFYDEKIKGVDKSESKTNKRAEKRCRDITQLAGPVTPTRILDIGCADDNATVLKLLKQKYHIQTENTIGVDIKNIEPQGFVFHKVENNKIPVDDASIDLATLLMVAHHFSDADAMLQEIHRILKPGGLLVIREHDISSKWKIDPLFIDIIHMLYDCIINEREDPSVFFKNYFSYYKRKDEWISIFKKNGLTIVRHQGPAKDDIFRPFYALFTRN